MSDKTVKKQYFVEKSKEKHYIRIPFDVPDNVDVLRIRYTYAGDGAGSLPTENEKNVIDFGLIGPDGLEVGATGSVYRDIKISAAYSSRGYKKRAVDAGVWQIILGAYLIKSAGVNVVYEIEFTYKKPRYYLGDTHVHTLNSDGSRTYEEVAKMAVGMGLEYVIFTDHNNTTEGLPLPSLPKVTCIPGLELTNYYGHINMIGVPRPYDGSYAADSFEDFLKQNKQAKQRGALQSFNHPFCSLCPWVWPKEGVEVDCVEVWNGPMRRDNLKTLDWWQKQLEGGRRLYAIGGSDYHRSFGPVKMFARPCTAALSDSAAGNDILNALRKGSSVILASPKTPFIDIRSGETRVGGEVKLKDDTFVTVTCEKLYRGDTLKVYSQKGTVFEYKAKKSQPYTLTLPVEEAGFVRAEVVFLKKPLARIAHKLIMRFLIPAESKMPVVAMPRSLTNPIWFVD